MQQFPHFAILCDLLLWMLSVLLLQLPCVPFLHPPFHVGVQPLKLIKHIRIHVSVLNIRMKTHTMHILMRYTSKHHIWTQVKQIKRWLQVRRCKMIAYAYWVDTNMRARGEYSPTCRGARHGYVSQHFIHISTVRVRTAMSNSQANKEGDTANHLR